MDGRYVKAAVLGALYGVAFGWFVFHANILTAASTGLIWALVVEYLADQADAKRGTPEVNNRLGTIGVLAGVGLSIVAGYSLFGSLGPFAAFPPLFFFLPIQLWLWRERWSATDEVALFLTRLGTENRLRNLLGAGAALGLLLGIWAADRQGDLGTWFSRHLLGLIAWMLFGAALGGFIWMDADETQRRRGT